ncbi:hypothetical protein CLAFUR0_07202 [Fulvia fulva]|nr:hypothetical protein CLAFUR0_07202 [Fulvia fulva]
MSSPRVRALLFGFEDSPLLDEINTLAATLRSIGWTVNQFWLPTTDYKKANVIVESALGQDLPADNSHDTLFVYYGGYALQDPTNLANPCAKLKWHAKCQHVVVILHCPFNFDTYPDWPDKMFKTESPPNFTMQYVALPAPATEVKLGRTGFDCVARGCRTGEIVEVPQVFSGLPTTLMGNMIGGWNESENLTVEKFVQRLTVQGGGNLGGMPFWHGPKGKASDVVLRGGIGD